MRNIGVNGCDNVAKKLAQYIPEEDRQKVKILDVAAGTGNVGAALKKFGFKIVDAIGKTGFAYLINYFNMLLTGKR